MNRLIEWLKIERRNARKICALRRDIGTIIEIIQMQQKINDRMMKGDEDLLGLIKRCAEAIKAMESHKP